MSRLHPILLTLICLFALAPLSAHAETLTDDKIRSFISSLEALQGMEDEYDELPDGIPVSPSSVARPSGSSSYSSSMP